MKQKRKYYGIIQRPDSKNVMGYINAKSLGWDTKTWRFSTYTHRINDARKFVRKVYLKVKKDPENFNLKSTIEKLRTDNKENETSYIRTVEKSLDDYLKRHLPKDCTKCVKKLNRANDKRNSKTIKFEKTIPITKHCRGCKNERPFKSYKSINSKVQHIIDRLGHLPTQNLTFDHIKRFILDMKKDYSDHTIANCLDFLKSCLNDELSDEKIQHTGKIRKVLEFRKHLKKGETELILNERPDNFTQDKLVKILNELKEDKDVISDSLSLCLEISFYYICRIDELLKLRLNQFEIVEGQGVLSLEPMKKGNDGEFFLNPIITEKLKNIKENSNGGKWFFPDPNDPERPLCYDQIYNKFKKAQSKSGVNNVVIHQLKIRATTDSFRAGLDVGLVQDLGRWKSPQMPFKILQAEPRGP